MKNKPINPLGKQDEDSPRSPSKIRRIAEFIIRVLTDYILMVFGIFFSITFLFSNPLFQATVVAIALIRRTRRIRRNFFVSLVFIALIVFTVDQIILIHSIVYGIHPLLVLIAPAAYLVMLKLRSLPVLEFDRLQCIIAVVLTTLCLSHFGGDVPPSEKECEAISRQPGLKLLVDSRDRRVRDVVELEGGSKLLVTYRYHMDSPEKRKSLFEIIDVKTGNRKILFKRANSGAIIQHSDGNLYAIVVRFDAFNSSSNSIELVCMDSRGNINYSVPMPAEGVFANKIYIYSMGEKLLVTMEGKMVFYDPKTRTFGPARTRPNSWWEAILKGNHLYGVSVHSFLTAFMPGNGYMLQEADAVTGETIKGIKNRPLNFGYYAIKEVGRTGRFAVNNLWTGGGFLYDFNLNRIGSLGLPRGTRDFGVDRDGKFIFAPNFFTGYMKVLDIAKNKLLPGRYYVGTGTRTVTATGDGRRVLIGNACGVVEFKLDRLQRQAQQ
jgi:hypothetical protein